MSCCEFADDEEVREHPETFDCEECPYRCQRATLTSEDQDALELYRQLARPVVQALRLTQLVIAVQRLRMSEDAALALLDKLDVIHECAPRAESPSSGDDVD